MFGYQPILFLIVGLTLAGCLSKMEGIAEETKNNVKRSSELIEETKDDTQAGQAYALLVTSMSWNEKDFEEAKPDLINTAETMIKKGKENRVNKYVGAPPGDLKLPTTYVRQPDKKDTHRLVSVAVPMV